MYEDRKIKSDVIAKIQAVIGEKAIFASNTSTLPITSLASEFKDPARFIGIHFFSPVDRMMLVEIILGKQTGRQGACGRARLCARHPQDTDRRQRLARLLHVTRCWHIHPRRPFDADRRGAARDDRECRPHGRHAGRPAVAQRRGGGRSCLENSPGDGGRSRRQGDRSAPESIAARKWSRSGAGSGARTARASTIIRRTDPSGCGPASPIFSRSTLAPEDVDIEELKLRLPRHSGVGNRPLLRGKSPYRCARSRRGVDSRFWLCAVFRRHVVVDRHDGHEALCRPVP